MTCHHHYVSKEKCYFCQSVSPLKDFQLADSCAVPACAACIIQRRLDRRIAQERGFFDPSKLSFLRDTQPQDGKDDDGRLLTMAEIQIAKESAGIPYIGKKLYQEKNVHDVKIISEFKIQDCDYQGKITQKPVGRVATKNSEIPEAVWEMNKATQNYFVGKFGTDSTKWIKDEWIPIKLAAAGNANPSIYPKEVSLEKTF